MRTLMIQPGARHGYALARFLYREDALQRLYTDFAVSNGSAQHLLLRLVTGLHPRARTLSRRVVQEVPQSLVRCLPPRELISKHRNPQHSEEWNFLSQDVDSADVIYSQYFAGGKQIDQLKAGGAKLVSDVFIMPSAHRIVNREAALFPEWKEAPFSVEEAAALDTITTTMIERSEGLFCPSNSVIDDIASYAPEARIKCRLVRYGSSLTFTRPNEPIRGRVLFAGTVQLRKGPQYLGLAAARIAEIDESVRFVFAGAVSDAAASQLQARNVELLGHVSRERMREEFLKADVLAFPSMAEGSAGVVLEAMSAGIPIVATREAGVDFCDGKSGILVPPACVEPLAEAIMSIISDRGRREAMGKSAREEFLAYDGEAWQAAFMSALTEFSRC